MPEYLTAQSQGGGLATFGAFLAEAISSTPGYSAEIVSPRMWNGAPESLRILNPKTWVRGVVTSVRTLGGTRVTYVGANLSEFEFMRYAPRKELDGVLNEFDAVIGVFGTPALVLMLKNLRVPTIAKVATLAVLERRELLKSLTRMRWLLAKANLWLTTLLDEKGILVPSRLMVINDWMFEYCRKRVGARVELAPPGVDTDYYVPKGDNCVGNESAAASAAGMPSNFLFVGRLGDPRKNIRSLLRSYSIACQVHGVNQKLVLAGLGDLDADDYRLIDELRLRDRVEIIRDVPRDELRDLYQQSDVFVLASAEEGLGIVLLEAMACGIPIVSSATEGARYAVGESDVGELIGLGPGFIDDFAACMAKWALDPDARQRAGLNGRRRVLERFSYHATIQKYLAAFADQ